ncbi:MAG: uridylate kinase [Oscillospiraceae bacterium]|jgi:glutamate 5-kinase|nr:uridylate kinase [Oscillospiraceae bacterium]
MEIELVGKIGSMALIRKEDNDVNYNILARLGDELRPGMVWVSSGATEIGRVDYMRRRRSELNEDIQDAKTDYAAQGQAILMANYRQFIRPEYGVRQLLVEHQHFNDPEKREHIRRLLRRAADQDAIPIINYNDPVSGEENRKMELAHLHLRGAGADIVECVDNDETAAVITQLLRAKMLVILTSSDGIYEDADDPSTLVRTVFAPTPDELRAKLNELQRSCRGASRAGANGMRAKLRYIAEPAANGATIIIGSARHRLTDLIEDRAPHTRIGLL